jgi:predicted Zn-dependent protease
MQELFNQFAKAIFKNLQNNEQISLSLAAENTFFNRINQSKIRQSTHVEQGNVNFSYTKNRRMVDYSMPFGKDLEINLKKGLITLEQCRSDCEQLPEDLFCPEFKNEGNSTESHTASYPNKEEWFDEYLPMLQGVDGAGLLIAGSVMRGSINSLGQNHWYQGESFNLDLSFYTPSQKAVKLIHADKNWSKRDFQKKVELAKEQLIRLDNPCKTISPGRYRTYFAPEAVADLTNTLSWNGVSASAYHQGKSAFKLIADMETELSNLFTLQEDFSLGMGPRFNSLGELSATQLPIVENGKLQNLLISTRTAKEYKLTSNQAEENEGLRSPCVNPGNLSEDKILNELGTGLYISNVHYLNWSDLNKGRLTGMTRYACFWVENGQIISPIKDMRFDETLYHFFGKGLVALTDKVSIIPDSMTYELRAVGGCSVPGILVDSFTYTL